MSNRALENALALHRAMKRQHTDGPFAARDADPGEKKWIRKWKRDHG